MSPHSSRELDPDRLRRIVDVGRSLVSELRLEPTLQRVLEVACELTGARYAALGVLDAERQGLARFITRGIDPADHEAIGDLPHGRGVLGVLIEQPKPLRLSAVSSHPRSFGFPAGHPPMGSFLGVPVLIRGVAFGNLYLTEKEGGADFDAADQASVIILADWAASANDNESTSDSSRLRAAMESAEAERSRWARELHDETLQGLGALKVLLAGALRSDDPARLREAAATAAEQVSGEIDNLRSLITELRPASLDALGLEPALRGMADRTAAREGIEVTCDVTLGDARLHRELETVVYRVAQEALTNVAKHARAERARVALVRHAGECVLEVADDGVGFDPTVPPQAGGFGLVGIRERVELVGGRLEVGSTAGDTVLRARFPV